jgi:hypothetical protein
MASSPQRLFSTLEAQYRLPQGYLNRLYQVESSGGRKLYNESSGAAGPFQFMPKTAKQYGLDDPYDLEESAKAAARLAADNRNALVRSGMENPSAGVLYLAHQQGATGALKLLSNTDKPAAELVGEKAVVLNAGKKDASAGEFASGIVGKFEGRTQQKALQPYSAVGETAQSESEVSPAELLEASAVPEAAPRSSRSREAYALNTLARLSQDLQPRAAPLLPVPRPRFAKGGIVSLVDGPETPAAPKKVSIPETTKLVAEEIRDFAEKGDLDIHKIAFLLRTASTGTMPQGPSYEFAQEILNVNVPALLERFRRYPRAIRVLGRLDLALGGLAGQGYGLAVNQHIRSKPQSAKRVPETVPMSAVKNKDFSGFNPEAMQDLSQYAVTVHGAEVGSNMVRRSRQLPDKLFYALNQYSKNVFGPGSPQYKRELKNLYTIARRHNLNPVRNFARTEDVYETSKKLDRIIKDVPKKDEAFRKAVIRLKALIGENFERRGKRNGR